VGKPGDSSSRVALQGLALGIQEVKVSLLLCHAGDGAGSGGAGRAGLHRRPTILSEDDLLAINPGVDPVQVSLDERLANISGGGSGAEER